MSTQKIKEDKNQQQWIRALDVARLQIGKRKKEMAALKRAERIIQGMIASGAPWPGDAEANARFFGQKR